MLRTLHKIECSHCFIGFHLVFQQEKQRAMLNELVGKVTSVCWDKCVGTPGSKFSSSETSCLQYCAQRYLETSAIILRRFGSLPQ